MKASMGAALRADAAGGSSAGLRQLEMAVSSHCERLLEDSDTPMKDKLIDCCDAVVAWLNMEGVNPLTTATPLQVSSHSAFGQMKATVLTQCTCTGSGDADKQSCMLHASEISVSDVTWEIAKVVHNIFNDQFVTFANLFLSQTVGGSQVVSGMWDAVPYDISPVSVYQCIQRPV